MEPDNQIISFGQLFKTIRFRAGFLTLQNLSNELGKHGLDVDSSLLSHWQREARLPKDRHTVLILIKVFAENAGILTTREADDFSAISGMGFLTDSEKKYIFPTELNGKSNEIHSVILEREKYYPDFLSPLYKVHFIGSLDGNKSDYKKIINVIRLSNFELITTHSLERKIEDIANEDLEESKTYVRKMKTWIEEADIVVIEATKSVFGAGYEAATALYLKKPVIILYHPNTKNSPFVLKGMESKKLQVLCYEDRNLDKILSVALIKATETLTS